MLPVNPVMRFGRLTVDYDALKGQVGEAEVTEARAFAETPDVRAQMERIPQDAVVTWGYRNTSGDSGPYTVFEAVEPSASPGEKGRLLAYLGHNETYLSGFTTLKQAIQKAISHFTAAQ